MSKLLSDSRVLTMWHTFPKKMRHANDIFLIHMVCREFCPKRVLEIGFYQGQTLGTLIDACDDDTQFVSVDIDFSQNHNFKSLYESDQSRITWICQDSGSVTYEGNFDLVLVDGDHCYDVVYNDLTAVLRSSHNNTILILDDYDIEYPNDRGVKGVIQDHLLGQHNWVPFLMGDQTMFFHHVSHAADEFLDFRIQEFAKNFIYFFNIQYNDHVVLRARTPNIFCDHIDLFQLALERYRL